MMLISILMMMLMLILLIIRILMTMMIYVYSEACNMDTWSGKITCVMTNYSFYMREEMLMQSINDCFLTFYRLESSLTQLQRIVRTVILTGWMLLRNWEMDSQMFNAVGNIHIWSSRGRSASMKLSTWMLPILQTQAMFMMMMSKLLSRTRSRYYQEWAEYGHLRWYDLFISVIWACCDSVLLSMNIGWSTGGSSEIAWQ